RDLARGRLRTPRERMRFGNLGGDVGAILSEVGAIAIRFLSKWGVCKRGRTELEELVRLCDMLHLLCPRTEEMEPLREVGDRRTGLAGTAVRVADLRRDKGVATRMVESTEKGKTTLTGATGFGLRFF